MFDEVYKQQWARKTSVRVCNQCNQLEKKVLMVIGLSKRDQSKHYEK